MKNRLCLLMLLPILVLPACQAPYEVISRGGDEVGAPVAVDAYPPFPLEADRNYRVGMEMAGKKRYKDALFYLEKVIESMSENVEALYNIAATYTYIDATSAQAESLYKQALAVENVSDKDKKRIIPLVYYNLAAIYNLRGKRDRAIDYLKKAFAAGFEDYHLIAFDPDFKSLRDHDQRLQRMLDEKWPD